MMLTLLFFILSLPSWTQTPTHWNSAVKITERHEFYVDGEVVNKPRDSWQVIFAVNYLDSQLSLQKDCVFYHVPGQGLGLVKLKRSAPETLCEVVMFHPGDKEWKDVKSLQFSTKDQKIHLVMTFPKYKSETWESQLMSLSNTSTPKLGMSSAELKSPKLIMLASGTTVTDLAPTFKLKQNDLCQKVSDDCEVSLSNCFECPGAWYEIPNGCAIGPKYCGEVECGKKNAPACRRGIEWQRVNKKFSCIEDQSFAYCQPGLKIFCEGALAYCR